MALVLQESRISFGLEWYDSEEEANRIVAEKRTMITSTYDKTSRASEFDKEINGKKIYAIKVR